MPALRRLQTPADNVVTASLARTAGRFVQGIDHGSVQPLVRTAVLKCRQFLRRKGVDELGDVSHNLGTFHRRAQ